MKLFKVEITTMTPITVVARTNPSAAEDFIMGCIRGFGNTFNADYEVTEWTPPEDDNHRAVLEFARAGRSGFAWPSTVPGGWELFAPWEQ